MNAMKERVRFLVDLFKATGERWSDVEGSRRGAAFSYYATFSIFPLLLLGITVIGFVIGDDAPARERMLGAIAAPGTPVYEALTKTLTAMQEAGGGARGLSAVVGVISLLFGASGAFVELDATLNRIWCVPERKSTGIVGAIKVLVVERLSGFAIVLGLGLTLIASLVMSAVFSALAKSTEGLHTWTPAIWKTSELALSIALMSAVFVAAFRYIPRSRPPFRDVVGGAVLTTVMLTILKEIFALYLSKLTSYSAYGLAGGMLGLATWIYLSSMIIFFGAQLTRIHAEMLGNAGDCEKDLHGDPVREVAPAE